MRRVTAGGVAAALALAGCGGGSSSTGTSATSVTTTMPDTTSAPAETTMAPDGTPTTRTAPPAATNGAAKVPERKPGGAGDEVPNSTQALVIGRAGKVTPATVSVPPFIAVTVELRSGDGKPYTLSGAGKTVRAGASKPGTASFSGLRSGEKITLTGPTGRVVITANAEPGP